MNLDRINARFSKAHGDVVKTWIETQHDSTTGDAFAVEIAEHADGFKRVVSATAVAQGSQLSGCGVHSFYAD